MLELSEMPDFKAVSPKLNQCMLKFDKGRLTKVTIYEIISLAINFAILILTALSYFNSRKS